MILVGSKYRPEILLTLYTSQKPSKIVLLRESILSLVRLLAVILFPENISRYRSIVGLPPKIDGKICTSFNVANPTSAPAAVSFP